MNISEFIPSESERYPEHITQKENLHYIKSKQEIVKRSLRPCW